MNPAKAKELDFSVRGEMRYQEPMRRHTSWHTGGFAQRAYIPFDLPDLSRFLRGHPAAEAITVAAKAGVKMEAFRDIVMAGGAASVMFGRLINVPLSDDDSSAKFAIKNARKDMRYYTNMTEQLPVASFMGESVHQLFVMAENMGFALKIAGVGKEDRAKRVLEAAKLLDLHPNTLRSRMQKLGIARPVR